MFDLSMLLEHLAGLHDHICPRQILGLRMGMTAGALLGLDLPQHDKRLYTFVETDGCFADGVLAATGCSLGHRTMRLIDYGKAAATFIDTETKRAIRITPHPLARTRAEECFPQEKSHWHAQLAAYQTMPADELFQAHEVALTLSLEAIISRPDHRVSCARCGEEILNEREIMVDGRPHCKSCVEQGYWSDGGALNLSAEIRRPSDSVAGSRLSDDFIAT